MALSGSGMRTARHVSNVANHAGPATSCAPNSNGTLVVSGGWDNLVYVSDLRNTNSRSIGGHTDWLLATAAAPTADVCASAGWDNTVRVWTTSAYSRKHVLSGHLDTVTSLSISPDSRFLASTSYDTTIKVWNLTGGTNHTTLVGHRGHANKVAFVDTLPYLLLSAGDDGGVNLWDLQNGMLSNEFKCKAPATACDATMNGSGELFMAFGDAIGTIYTARLHKQRN